MEDTFNILLTTMSILQNSIDLKNAKHYYYVDKNGKEISCDGFCTMEPGSKYFLHKYRIDKIVAISTNATMSKTHKIEKENNEDSKIVAISGENEEDIISANEFYEMQIKKYLAENSENNENMRPHPENTKEPEFCFVSEQTKEGQDNINGIVKEILKDSKQNTNLYIDVQGGSRTSAYVRNAVLSILNSQHINSQHNINLMEIVATSFSSGKEKHQIIDETSRYKILDLVAGMNAFIQYGKADMIDKYCQDMKIDEKSKVNELVKNMNAIDDAISLCDVTNLTESIKKMANVIKDFSSNTSEANASQDKNNGFVENVFDILSDGIKNDYGDLLTEPDNPLKLIKWCVKKKFIQQALTLIEDKMPKIYFDKKIFSYDDNNKELIKSLELGHDYETDENKIFYSLKYRLDSEDDEDTKKYRSKSNNNKECATEDALMSVITKLNDYINTKQKDSEQKNSEQKNSEQKDSEQKDSDFIDNYCKFHRIQTTLNRNKKYTSFQDRNSIAKLCGGTHTYKKGKYKPNDKDKQTVEITLNIHEKLQKEPKLLGQLDQLMLLHEALKKERNICNHASDSIHRLSIKHVIYAIELFVIYADGIFKNVSESV